MPLFIRGWLKSSIWQPFPIPARLVSLLMQTISYEEETTINQMSRLQKQLQSITMDQRYIAFYPTNTKYMANHAKSMNSLIMKGEHNYVKMFGRPLSGFVAGVAGVTRTMVVLMIIIAKRLQPLETKKLCFPCLWLPIPIVAVMLLLLAFQMLLSRTKNTPRVK